MGGRIRSPPDPGHGVEPSRHHCRRRRAAIDRDPRAAGRRPACCNSAHQLRRRHARKHRRPDHRHHRKRRLARAGRDRHLLHVVLWIEPRRGRVFQQHRSSDCRHGRARCRGQRHRPASQGLGGRAAGPEGGRRCLADHSHGHRVRQAERKRAYRSRQQRHRGPAGGRGRRCRGELLWSARQDD